MKFWSEGHRENYYNQAARKTFERLLDEGHDPDEIIAASRAYAIEISSSGATPLPLAEWLETKAFTRHRN
jgi:hypothetical protein